MAETTRKRDSSVSNKTINTVTFDKSRIDEVIADIGLNTRLCDIKVSSNTIQQPGFTLDLVLEGLRVHIADIVLMGGRYLALFDPHLDDYKEENSDLFEQRIKPVYQELNELLLKYVPEKVKEYVRRTTPKSS